MEEIICGNENWKIKLFHLRCLYMNEKKAKAIDFICKICTGELPPPLKKRKLEEKLINYIGVSH
jgi:hypothetical protein